MSKRERPGYAVITLEVPIEVAEWLAVSGVSTWARSPP